MSYNPGVKVLELSLPPFALCAQSLAIYAYFAIFVEVLIYCQHIICLSKLTMSRYLFVKSAFFVFSMLFSLTAKAQAVFPLFHFHQDAQVSSVSSYHDNYLSGFMQGVGTDKFSGFLQMPFIGRPILVYVGEKDSTQYMAYASSYKNLNESADQVASTTDLSNQKDLNFYLGRYGINAQVKTLGTIVEQTYVFPDTVAEKGFLIDIDHALNGLEDGNMSVRFVDHQTICAFKKQNTPEKKTQYYYARFSKRFDSYNIRRESVTLKNGTRESRLKAVFTFDLQKDEPLKVVSAVSTLSADAAYAAVEGHMPKSALTNALLASAPKTKVEKTNESYSANNTSKRDDKPSHATSVQSKPQRTTQSRTANTTNKETSCKPSRPISDDSRMSDKIVVETRDAALRTSFYVALERVMQISAFRKLNGASDFMQKLSSEMLTESDSLIACADSLVKTYVSGSMSGAATSEDVTGRNAMRFLVCAMGLYPHKTQGAESQIAYRLEHPFFNVVTLYYNDNRRFILHVKNATTVQTAMTSVTFNGAKLEMPPTIDQTQLLRGGVLAVKM